MGAPARAIALTGADQAVLDKPGVYKGITVHNSGDAGTITLYDNDSAASGTIVDVIAVGADASVSLYYECGIWVADGIYADVDAGTFTGSVRVG